MPRRKTKSVSFWETRSGVRNVSFHTDSSGELVLLGGHLSGVIHAARITLKNGCGQDVAVKRFLTPLTDAGASRFKDVIAGLGEAMRDPDTESSMFPDMKMLLLRSGQKVGPQILVEDEWVQVSHLYARHNPQTGALESELVNKSWLDIKTQKARLQAVGMMVMAANAGYYPAADLIEPFRDARKGVVPIDVDVIVQLHKSLGEPSPQTRAAFLIQSIEQIGGTLNAETQAREYRRLFDFALENSSEEMRGSLSEVTPDFSLG